MPTPNDKIEVKDIPRLSKVREFNGGPIKGLVKGESKDWPGRWYVEISIEDMVHTWCLWEDEFTVVDGE
jgi:hypothetical protein